jgi:DNA-binding CsgD family transcriptional regulator
MLHSLQLGNVRLRRPDSIPGFLVPLFDAASRGLDLTPAIHEITRGLGFDNFMQGVSMTIRPNSETQSFVFTTLPVEWVALYDQKAYLEVDPRIQRGIESRLPYIWQSALLLGRSGRLDDFLKDAAGFGVGSGVSISFRCANGWGGLIALSSSSTTISRERRREIEHKAGDVMALGQYFHELVIGAILEKQLEPASRGVPLSARERQCLSLAANGMTSRDIGVKLGISERTANFHFSNIFSKLDVLNRNEAIAIAISKGMISPPT